MYLPPACLIEVSHLSDASEARRLVKLVAETIGFSTKDSEDLAIVVSELASNIVIHAQYGRLVLTPVEEKGRRGIKIESQDNGPGIADVERAIIDGFSTVGGLGYGLGTVNRLMDEFDVRSQSGGQTGTLITCLRWKRESSQETSRCPISFGVATRSRLNAEFNGDTFVVKEWNRYALIALIDGLGHGEFAHQAARQAREYVENHYDRPLPVIFWGVGRACRATRGVVMAVALFDWSTRPMKLAFGSIGNIEARVFGCPTPMNLVAQRGVIGLNAPQPVIAEYRWNPAYVMVLHSDGLSRKWCWSRFPELTEASAVYTARSLLQILAGNEDDATVIVVREC